MKARMAFSVIAALLITGCSESPVTPQSGNLRVITATAGGELDQDGYVLVLDLSTRLAVGLNAFTFFDKITAGTHVLTLEGVAENCTVTDTHTLQVTVASGGNAEVKFAVTCVATGIEINTRTTGSDLPLGDYVVKFDERTVAVAPNGTVLLSFLVPGSYTVSLSVPAANCSITGGNPATVNVSSRAVTPVTFEIVCVRIDKRIAFVRDSVLRNGMNVSSVLSTDANGSSIVPLAPGHAPAWSPDGTRLAYSDFACDDYYLPCTGGLMMLDLNTGATSIPSNSRLGVDPSWSPDGKFIAFTRPSGNLDAHDALYVSGPDGSAPTRLGTPDINAWSPSWSPDGQRIVYQCWSPGQHYQICVINRDGTGNTRLTSNAGWHAAPAWSPDGKTIAYVTDQFAGENDIALMTPSGTGVTRLTRGSDPAWSPDGSKLIFAADDGLFTIGADGSDLTRITTGRHRAPAWRP